MFHCTDTFCESVTIDRLLRETTKREKNYGKMEEVCTVAEEKQETYFSVFFFLLLSV